jgi:hypothetical protein
MDEVIHHFCWLVADQPRSYGMAFKAIFSPEFTAAFRPFKICDFSLSYFLMSTVPLGAVSRATLISSDFPKPAVPNPDSSIPAYLEKDDL